MAISYLSTAPLKSNPYVLPVNLDLMAKVLTFKETSFKTNASKIQQQLDSAYNADLIKSEDKDYLNNKVSSIVDQLNSIGNVDIGSINVANQLSGLATSVYQDKDIIEAISSTQKVRSLQSSYDKLRTDPKQKGMFASQNMAYDMQAVNQWLSSGRTTANSGYSGPTSATPYVDIDKAAIESAKLVKANYTKSSIKDGIYIHNVTGEEVTEDAIANQVRNTLTQNPQYLTQANINAWYLRQDATAEDIKKDYTNNLKVKADYHKAVYDDYMKDYNLASSEQKLKMESQRAILEKNKNAFENAFKDANTSSLMDFQNNLGSYRTELYLDNMVNHIASSMSYKKETDEVKPDLAAQAFLKNQIEVAKHGGELVPDPTSPSGWAVVGIKPQQKSSSKNSSSKGTGGTGNTAPWASFGQPMVGLNTEDKEALKYTDDKVTGIISEKNEEKQVEFQSLLNDLLITNPDLAKTYGINNSFRYLKDTYSKLNNPNSFEIEDIKEASKSKYITKEQSEYLSKLWKSFEAIQKGQKPILELTPSQMEKLNKIHLINQETEFLSELRNESMGVGTDGLTQSENEALQKKQSIKLPKTLFSIQGKRIDGNDEYLGWTSSHILATAGGLDKAAGSLLGTALNQVKNDLAALKGQTLHVIEKDGKYIPFDGKEHKYTANFLHLAQDERTGKRPVSESIVIPATGITKEELQKYFTNVSNRVISNESALGSVKLLETRDQQDLLSAETKLTSPKLKKKNPDAYNILNNVNQYINLAIPSDIEEQSKDGVLSMIKTGIAREAELGSTSIKDKTGKPIEGRMSLKSVDLSKSYIARIGSSTSNYRDVEAEIVLMSEPEPGAKSKEIGRIKKTLNAQELSQLGITLPDRKQQLRQMQVDYYGRTKPMVILPNNAKDDAQLAVTTEIVRTGDGEYTPFIRMPLRKGGPLELVPMKGGSFPNLIGTSPDEAEQLMRNYVTSAYSLGGIRTTEQLFDFITTSK